MSAELDRLNAAVAAIKVQVDALIGLASTPKIDPASVNSASEQLEAESVAAQAAIDAANSGQ